MKSKKFGYSINQTLQLRHPNTFSFSHLATENHLKMFLQTANENESKHSIIFHQRQSLLQIQTD